MTLSTPLPPEADALVRQYLGDEDWSSAPLAGDASVRANYRVSTSRGETWMVTFYPPEVREQLHRFVSAFEAVSPYAPLPRLVAQSSAAILQEDVGGQTIFATLHEDPASGRRLYGDAAVLLAGFQKARAEINPPFTATWFASELEMTAEYYVGRLMKQAASPALHSLFTSIADNVAGHPTVLCHRDYHGQNIHLHNGKLFIIDYQDMRKGPDTYDLASLLRDRGVGALLGRQTELELVARYCEQVGGDRGMRHRYFEALLQRSLKILGTFARQPIERGKLHYLDFIVPALDSIRTCLEELPEYRLLADELPMKFSVAVARARLG